MHGDPPPIVFEPRMKGTKKAIDIHEANNICWAKDAALNRGAFCDSIENRNWPVLREQKKSRIIPHYPSIIVVFNFVLAPKSSEEGTSRLFPPFFFPIRF